MSQVILQDQSYDDRWATLWKVELDAARGLVYHVGRTARGDFGCSCPHWTRYHSPCEHINQVLLSLAGKPLPRPAAESSRFMLIE